MLNQLTLMVLVQYCCQAALAMVVMFLIRRFYRKYDVVYFKYWWWSWVAFFLFAIGSFTSLINVFYFPVSHPFRLGTSIITISAGFFQILWLFLGSYNWGIEKKFNNKLLYALSIVIIPISIILVFSFVNDPSGSEERIFLRVGVRTFFSALGFLSSVILLFTKWKEGNGIKLIIVSFFLVGLQNINAFIYSLSAVLPFEYIYLAPYYSGIIELLFQAVMGLGMIISVLEKESSMLKKANNELDVFLYRTSHDLRSPLTNILGLAEIIRSEKINPQTHRLVKMINRSVEKADNVIRDIIFLKKSQKVKPKFSTFSLETIIRSEVEKLTKKTHVQIILNLSSTAKSSFLFSDESKIRSIFNNLITNSIKYKNSEQESVNLEVTITSNIYGLLVNFKDDGSGIEEKHVSRIFDMFYRSNANSDGSGLGLYIVKELIEQLEGNIKLINNVGNGCLFTLFLKNHRTQG